MTKRRGHGDGSVYRRASDGMWVGVVQIGQRDGKRVRKYAFGRTRVEAAAKLRELQATLAAGLPVPNAKLTVGEYLERWLQDVLPGEVKSINTLDNSTWAVRSHILPALGPHPLVRLSPAHVAEFLRAKRDAGLAPNTVMRFRSVLIAALDHAVLEGLVVRNVASLVRAPLGRTTEGRTLTVEQATALLDAAKGERLSAALTTMLMLGLRPGEVLALRWSDVDLDHRVLHVRHALKRERNQLRIGLPKTARSCRSLRLPTPVFDALVEHRRRQAEERAAAGADWRNLDLVFSASNGNLTDPSNFRRDFDRITTKAGLGHWHPHELRHSAVSLLSAAGVPIEVVADLMGHTTTRTTERVYRHLVEPVQDGAVDAIEKLFRRRDTGNDRSPDIR